VQVGHVPGGIGHGSRRRHVHRVAGGEIIDELDEIREDEEHDADPEKVEEEVGPGDPPGRDIRTDGRQVRSDGGPDIVPQNQCRSPGETHHSAGGQGYHEPHGGRAALEYHGHDRSHQHSQNRHAGKMDEDIVHPRGGAQGHDPALHDEHAVEEQAESQEEIAPIADPLTLAQDLHEHAHAHHGQRDIGEFEGDDLGGHGGADIGAEDHPEGLLHGHEPGIHQAHGQDRGGARTLNDGGNGRPGKDRHDPVRGKLLQYAAQSRPCYPLERIRHQMHPEEEEPQASKRREKNFVNHANTPEPPLKYKSYWVKKFNPCWNISMRECPVSVFPAA